jgi:membrane protease YdiL (CAAX protease family)
MKKFLIIIYFVLIVGWVKLLFTIFDVELGTMQLIVTLVLAPFIEEFIFRYLPIKYGTKWKIERECMWLFAYLFAMGHVNNYSAFGWHMAMLIQGVFALACWRLMKKTNYLTVVIMHSAYNFCIFHVLAFTF